MVPSINKLKFQKTIKDKISISGIGLHTGVSSTITLKPSPENHGIKFKRIDLKGDSIIEAVVENVTDVTRGTTIGRSGIDRREQSNVTEQKIVRCGRSRSKGHCQGSGKQFGRYS